MSDETFCVEWEVSDGYAGKSRPHSFTISASDLSDCESEDDAEALVMDMTQTEFEEVASWSITNYERVMDWIRETIQAREEGER